jgi:hypothetical protein
MEVTTSASFAWLRATRRTLNPARASCVANSRPMPSDAPVTTALRASSVNGRANVHDKMFYRPMHPSSRRTCSTEKSR